MENKTIIHNVGIVSFVKWWIRNKLFKKPTCIGLYSYFTPNYSIRYYIDSNGEFQKKIIR